MKFAVDSIVSLAALALHRRDHAAALALAEGKKPFEPQVGQPGKDVIWVPTPKALVEKMHDLAKTGPNDIHYDLGSGDGRSVIEGGQARRPGLRRRIQSGHGRTVARQRREGKAQRHRDLHPGRHLQDRLLEGQRHHALSADQPEREAASDHPGACGPAPAWRRTPSTWATGGRTPPSTASRAASTARRTTGWCRPRSRAPGS